MMNFVKEFEEWITTELDNRGWSRREAARRGGISQSMLNKVLNGDANPGLDFYRGIARAFRLSLIEVLQRAGELETGGNREEDIELDLLNDLFAQLENDDRAYVLDLIKAIVERRRARGNPSAPQTVPRTE